MGIETILEYLNAVPVRATYGAVGDVLGIRPQAVPRLLGAHRPETSWIVNGSTGEPTGYAPDEVDPRLPGTHVIRTGDELRRCLEGGAAAVPDTVPVMNGMAARGALDPEIIAMSGDAKWIIGTLVPVFMLVAGLLSAQIASVSRNLNTRIDDVNDRIDDLRTDFTAQIAGVHTRIDEVHAELTDEIAVLRDDVRSFAARLDAVETALGIDSGSAPASDAGGRTPDADAEAAPDAPAVNPDPQAEPPTDPVAPVVDPVPPRE